MIVHEAIDLDFINEIIDEEDNDKLTPIYLLCEEGYRKKYEFVDEEEEAEMEGFEKTVAVDYMIDKNNDGLEDDLEKQAEQQVNLENYEREKRVAEMEKQIEEY